MSCRGWMNNGDRDASGVPVLYVFGAFQLPNRKALPDPCQIVFEPVSHEDGFAVCAFDQVLQGVQFPVVKADGVLVLGVDRAVGQLAQFARECSCIDGVHFHIAQLYHQLPLQGVVGILLRGAEEHRNAVHHALRHLQVVGAFHGDGHVPDAPVDLRLCAGARLVREDLVHVPCIRHEELVAVVCNEPAQALAHVQQTELCPQIHQAIAGGCAGQADDTLDPRPDFQQAPESLGLVALEGGQFVNHDHVVFPADAAVLDEPLHILTVDDVQEGFLPKRRQALLCCTNSHRPGQPFQVIPFLNFGGPCVAGHPQGCDYQHPVYVETVEAQIVERGQGNDSLAQPRPISSRTAASGLFWIKSIA